MRVVVAARLVVTVGVALRVDEGEGVEEGVGAGAAIRAITPRQ